MAIAWLVASSTSKPCFPEMLADDLTPPACDDTLIALESVHEELHAEQRGQEEAERDRTGVRRRDLVRAEGNPQQVTESGGVVDNQNVQ